MLDKFTFITQSKTLRFEKSFWLKLLSLEKQYLPHY